jgi:general secretion pathway protein E
MGKVAPALYYFNMHKTIGEILIDQGLISSKQLEAALSKQKFIKEKWEHIRPLGLLLIEMNYINSRGLLTALSNYFNMPILSLKNYKPNPKFQKVIGERYAMEHKIIVLDNGPKTIKIVQAEPSFQIMEDLQKAISPGKVIEFYLASYSEIDESLRKVAAPISSTQHL